ncbi:cell division protein FtsA [bacterium]|nr:cell division protein FtsA [bacterium]
MPAEEIIVGVDIGSTKVTTVIAEVSEDGEAAVLGVGHRPSPGMKRGTVVNIEKTVDAVRESVAEAEEQASVKVHSVYVGIAGDHIRSINSKGVIAVPRTNTQDRTGVITRADVDRVIEAAKAFTLPMEREILHVLPQRYSVDEQNDIDDPVGMSGVRLEADVHIITSAVTSAQNIIRCVKQADIQVEDMVLQPLASSYSVLTPDEREMGVCLIDIGGGTTDLAVFSNDSIHHTSVIGMGGENVTRDLGIGLRTPFDQAERLKREHGNCFAPLVNLDERIEIPGIGGRESQKVTQGDITEIIQMRMEEIFTDAISQLRKAGVWNMLYSGGVVLTGGSSLIHGARELAEDMFGLPVKIGFPQGLDGLMQTARSPVYSTAVGLVLYGIKHGEGGAGYRNGDPSFLGKVFGRMREWIVEFF